MQFMHGYKSFYLVILESEVNSHELFK